MSDAILFTISLAVTVVGLLGSWAAYRRRGAASGMRGAAWSLVPIGGYLTGLTKFLADLVFSPVKWTGVAVLALGAVLYMASGVMLRRGGAGAGGRKSAEGEPGRRSTTGTPAKGALERGGAGADADLAEIEQILKKRGIS